MHCSHTCSILFITVNHSRINVYYLCANNVLKWYYCLHSLWKYDFILSLCFADLPLLIQKTDFLLAVAHNPLYEYSSVCLSATLLMDILAFKGNIFQFLHVIITNARMDILIHISLCSHMMFSLLNI